MIKILKQDESMRTRESSEAPKHRNASLWWANEALRTQDFLRTSASYFGLRRRAGAVSLC